MTPVTPTATVTSMSMQRTQPPRTHGQTPLLYDVPLVLEEEARRIDAQLLARTPAPAGESPDIAAPGFELRPVDVGSLELMRPRNPGAE